MSLLLHFFPILSCTLLNQQQRRLHEFFVHRVRLLASYFSLSLSSMHILFCKCIHAQDNWERSSMKFDKKSLLSYSFFFQSDLWENSRKVSMNSITLFLCYFLSDYLSKIFHWDSLVVVQKRESVMIRGIFTSFFRYRDMRYALQLYECIIINLIYVEWSECEEVEVSEINNSEQWDVVDVVQLLCCWLLVTRGWVPQATADLLCICRAKIQIQMLIGRHQQLAQHNNCCRCPVT